jgi:two-component system C4-dicarboxylate transport response regulator DctD
VSKRILVVDDQDSMRTMIADLLEIIGHEPHAVEDAETALLELEQGPAFDLVITDLNMPVMDGLQLMHEIRTRNDTLPVIIITGFATFRTEKQVLESGAAGFIAKPCTLNRVQETVQSALGIAS